MESKTGLIRNNRCGKPEERTSSILKTVSTERSALNDIDPNQKDGCDIPKKKARRSSRRVSFAETYLVKEYIRESPHPWTVDIEDEPEENERDTQQEQCEPGNRTITGFDKLLTGTIWTRQDTGEVDQFQELLEYPLPPDSDDSIHTSHLSTINQTILCNSMDPTCENVPPDNVYDILAPDDFGDQGQKESATFVLERILNHGKQAPVQEKKSVPDLRRKNRSPLESLTPCSENDKEHVICTTSSPVQPFWQRIDSDDDNVKSFLSQMFDTRKNTIQSQIIEMNENTCLDDTMSMDLTEVLPCAIEKDSVEADSGKITQTSKDKTLQQSFGMEMTECLPGVIDVGANSGMITQTNKDKTLRQSFGMEMTECLPGVIDVRADSGKITQTNKDKTLRQSFGMEMTECLPGVIDVGANSGMITQTNKDKTLWQSFGMEMTECLPGVIDVRADSGKITQTNKDKTLRQSFGMEMTECLPGVIDVGANSGMITQTNKDKTLWQSFGMEMTECLPGVIDVGANSGMITQTNKDKTLRQSFGMEMTECLPGVIDVGANSGMITQTNKDKTLWQSFGMEMTECLPGVIDVRANSGMITQTNKDKTLRQSFGMEMTDCGKISVQSLLQKFAKPSQATNKTNDPTILDNTRVETDFSQSDKTVSQVIGVEMTECFTNVIETKSEEQQMTHGNNYTTSHQSYGMQMTEGKEQMIQKKSCNKTLHQSFGMETKENLMAIDSEHYNRHMLHEKISSMTLRQSFGMEMTECLPGVIDVGANNGKITQTNKDKTLRQSFGMEVTECLPGVIDVGANSGMITQTNKDKTLQQSFGMEMTECLPGVIDVGANSGKITQTNKDKTLQQSFGMDMTECLPSAIDIRHDSKITQTNKDKTLRQSFGMEMTECLPGVIDVGANSGKIVQTNKVKTLQQSFGMEMTECLPGVIDVGADSGKITQTIKDKTLRQSFGMEMTECLPGVIDVGANSGKITQTNKDKTLRQSFGMEMTECLPGVIDVGANSGMITQTNKDKTLWQSFGMEMTECLPGVIDVGANSGKITQTNKDKTLRQSFGMEMTECLPDVIDVGANSGKITQTNKDKTLRQSFGMEMTECLPSAIDIRHDSKITQTNKDKTLRQSFGMEMTECLSVKIDTVAESSKITKTRQDKTKLQFGMEITDCKQNAINTKGEKKVIECSSSSDVAEIKNLSHKVESGNTTDHLSEGLKMTCSIKNISKTHDSVPNKLRKADRTNCNSLGLVLTESLEILYNKDNKGYKDSLDNIDTTQLLPMGMELTECLSNVFDTSNKTDKPADTNTTQFHSFEIDMNSSVGDSQPDLEGSDSVVTMNLSETKMYTVEMEMTNCTGGISHHKENEESSWGKNEEQETFQRSRCTAKDGEKPCPEKVWFPRTYSVSDLTDTGVVGTVRDTASQEDRKSNVESTVTIEMTKCVGEFEKGKITSVDFTKCEGFMGNGTKVGIELDSEITSNINKSIDCLHKLRSALSSPCSKINEREVTKPHLGQEKSILDSTSCIGVIQDSTSTILKGTLTNHQGCQEELTDDRIEDTSNNVPESEENRDNAIGNKNDGEKRESQKLADDKNIFTDMKLLHVQSKEDKLSTDIGADDGDNQLRMLKTPNERRASSVTLKRKLQHLENFVLKGRGKTLRKSDIIGAMSSSTPSFVRSKSTGEGRLGVFESSTTLPESFNIETADEVLQPQVDIATKFENNDLRQNSSNLKNVQERLGGINDNVGKPWISSSDKDMESLCQKEYQRNITAETCNLEDEVPYGLSMSTINGNEMYCTSMSSVSVSEARSEEASQNKSILSAVAGLSHSLCISEGPLTVDTFLKLMLAHKAERVQWTRRSSLALIPEIDPDNIDMVLVAKMKTEPEAKLFCKVYQDILAQQERNKKMNQFLDQDLEETQPPIFQSALSLSENELHNLRKQVQSLQSACIKQTKMAWKKEMKMTGEKFLAELKVNTQRTNEVTEEIVSANETITSLSEDLDSDIKKVEDEIAFLESKSPLSEEELLVWQENQEKITEKQKELMECQTRVDYHKDIKKNLMSKVDALTQEIEEVQKKIDYHQKRNTDEQRKLLDDLEQQINIHQSVNEWELETLTEDLAVFLFLKGTLVLSVNIQSHEGAKVIESVSLSSTLPENANQWDRLAQSLALSAIDTKVLESKFRKTALPQMLHEVASIISEVRLLVRDVYLSSLRNLVIIQPDKSVTFNIYSIKTLCDILVNFRFDGMRPLSNPVQTDVQTILGDVSTEQILKNLSMVKPGPRYVHRLLECINLESDVS